MSVAESAALASRVQRLERQLESYRHLHNAELDQIRRTLQELKDQILFLTEQETAVVDHPESETNGGREKP